MRNVLFRMCSFLCTTTTRCSDEDQEVQSEPRMRRESKVKTQSSRSPRCSGQAFAANCAAQDDTELLVVLDRSFGDWDRA
jgi:hypothetical protein